MMKNAFLFHLKSSFLKILNFLPWRFGQLKKQLVKKVKANFKVYDGGNWETNNYNAHIALYLEKSLQLDNEIWSVNGT